MGKDQSLNLPYPLVLASTSKYRGALLAQLGWSFEAISPGVDEDKIKNGQHTPRELALLLSKMKAHAVFARHPHSCVIGSDQVCAIGEKIFGKPGTKERACQQLMDMQGKTHELLTAVTILAPDHEISFLNSTALTMRKFSFKEAHDYVEADLPLDCAGSYKLESKGIKLFEKIEMTDQTSIIGLPLIELSTHLLKLGYPLSF